MSPDTLRQIAEQTAEELRSTTAELRRAGLNARTSMGRMRDGEIVVDFEIYDASDDAFGLSLGFKADGGQPRVSGLITDECGRATHDLGERVFRTVREGLEVSNDFAHRGSGEVIEYFRPALSAH